jgi:DNA-binding NarL/FixJ family response regulator
MSRTRVVLADDHTLILEAFRKLLELEFEVVGTAADGHELVRMAQRLVPDVVVLDINMPLLNGIDAAQQVKAILPAVKLVFLTMDPDPDLAKEALQLGASGYLLKTSAASELSSAIRDAVRGKKHMTPLMKRELEKDFLDDPGGKKIRPELTVRQREVLQLLAEGHPMKEIAGFLNMSQRTVAFHKYRMMTTLRLKNSAELVQYAIKHHIIPA